MATPALCVNAIRARWAGALGLESLSSSPSQDGGQPSLSVGLELEAAQLKAGSGPDSQR